MLTGSELVLVECQGLTQQQGLDVAKGLRLVDAEWIVDRMN